MSAKRWTLTICLPLACLLLAGCQAQPAGAGTLEPVLLGFRLVSVTDESGQFTVKGDQPIAGRLYAVEWIPGDLAEGVDAAVSLVDGPSGLSTDVFFLADAAGHRWYYPRVVVHAQDGTPAKWMDLPIVAGIPQLKVMSGGAHKSGGCILYYYH